MSHIQVIGSEQEFETTVKSGTVLVDFFATWCRPCQMQLAILEEVAAEVNGKAKVVKVDTDQLNSLASKFDVSSIPTIVILHDGNLVDRFVGVQQAHTLKAALENAGK